MMKLNLRTPVPTAQLEVWEMKKALYERVKQLPTEMALQQLLEQAAETSRIHSEQTLRGNRVALSGLLQEETA